jgi:hypothetical protein
MRVTVTLYDPPGRAVPPPVNSVFGAGVRLVPFYIRNPPNGFHMVEMSTGKHRYCEKVEIIR